MWRMPLFNHYTKHVTDAHLADLQNIGKQRRYNFLKFAVRNVSLEENELQEIIGLVIKVMGIATYKT